jgi:hypothetical protein
MAKAHVVDFIPSLPFASFRVRSSMADLDTNLYRADKHSECPECHRGHQVDLARGQMQRPLKPDRPGFGPTLPRIGRFNRDDSLLLR